jgi:preprotein translocase subunit SecE
LSIGIRCDVPMGRSCRQARSTTGNKIAAMNSKAETEGRFDNLKWAVVAVLVVAGIAGNIYFDDQSLLYRVLGLLALGALAAFVALQTVQGAAFWRLAREARMEIRKVVWPTRQETTQTTLVVVVFVLLSALLLWGLDTLLGWLASLIIGLR